MLSPIERIDLFLLSCNASNEGELETFLSHAGLSLGRFGVLR